MQVIDSIDALRAVRRALPGTVAFVPTMGFLHEGHLSLMREARKRCDHLVVSIYVNPTQFGPNEDLERYPRDLEGDRARCEAEGCTLLFVPDDAMMYPPGHATRVRVEGLAEGLCGRSRPSHFEGVTTIVTKLFNIVRPDVALFGEKDYQQLAIIRRMVADLDMGIEIVGCPIVREPDGLAMSSRNRYLSAEERPRALALSEALMAARRAYVAGERNAGALVALVREHIAARDGVRLDYVECVDPESLATYDAGASIDPVRGARIAVAAFVGQTRLIDNILLDRDPAADAAQGA